MGRCSVLHNTCDLNGNLITHSSQGSADVWGHIKMAENYYNYGYVVPSIRHNRWEVKFLTQPPEDLRKSNFFSFTLELRYENGPLYVETATFVEFLNEHENDLRNGIKYKIDAKASNGLREVKFLYLILVDASTLEPIKYEGQDDSRKLQRVLLTHEAICTRCRDKKSCGNKSEAPSDPRIIANVSGQLQFFLKCNQNCLKGAGNPRDMRRFALAVSFEDIVHSEGRIAALSSKIFVHNNSKHSRKRKKEECSVKQEIELVVEPSDLMYIHPKIGLVGGSFSFNSKHWCKPGISFRIGSINLLITSMMYNTAMTVDIPYSLHSGKHLITMFLNHTPVFGFYYEISDDKYPEMNRGFLCLLEQHMDGANLQEHNNEMTPVLRGPQLQFHFNQSYAYTAGTYRYEAIYSRSSSIASTSPQSSSVSPPSMNSQSGSDRSPVFSTVGY